MTEFWGVDAALGAASILARTTRSVAETVARTPPAKAVEAVARRASQPLVREGERVRAVVVDDAGPTASRTVQWAMPGVLEAVRLNDVLAAIDLNRVLEQIDLDAVLGRLDLNALLARIDLDAVLGRIDLNALLAGVDLDELIAGLDVDALVGNTELGSLIAKSTSGVASEALDAVRSQGVGLDNLVGRIVTRAMRRTASELPQGPVLLVGPEVDEPSTGADEPSPNGADGPSSNGSSRA